MSRRRDVRPHQLHVKLTLKCGRPLGTGGAENDEVCGGDLGAAFQFRDQHPRAGQSVFDGRDGVLTPRPDGGDTWAPGRCRRCGASPQRRWEDIVRLLDQLDERGRWHDVHHIA
jgi:hypothetical protein